MYVWSEVNIWNGNCARATAFIFNIFDVVYSLRPSDAYMRRRCHHLNQRWNIVDWTFRNKLQWLFYGRRLQNGTYFVSALMS